MGMKSKFLAAGIAALFTMSAGAAAASRKTSPPHATRHHATHAAVGKSKTVHVRGYTKKNGKYVRSYNRRPPNKWKTK